MRRDQWPIKWELMLAASFKLFHEIEIQKKKKDDFEREKKDKQTLITKSNNKIQGKVNWTFCSCSFLLLLLLLWFPSLFRFPLT